MELDDHLSDTGVVVDVRAAAPGDLDAPALLRDRLRALAARGYNVVLLNLADVIYVDSVLLGAIVQAYVATIRSGGSLKLLNVSQRLRDLLRITKLDRVIETADRDPRV
jgi:anti-sigma B factor antagonist